MFLQHKQPCGAIAVALSLLLAFPVAAYGAAPAEGAPHARGAKAKKAKKASKKPAPGSSLEGRVFEADGKKPIRGARVIVQPLDGGDPIVSFPTDPKGRFALRHLRYGWNQVSVRTDAGDFLADEAVSLPPGTKVELTFSLIRTADRPEGWWKARADEIPSELLADKAGLAETKQKLTGIEYWKSPAGIAILASVGAVALGAIALGGKYSPPSSAGPTPTPVPSNP